MSDCPIAETVDGMADEAASILLSTANPVLKEILSSLAGRIRGVVFHLREKANPRGRGDQQMTLDRVGNSGGHCYATH